MSADAQLAQREAATAVLRELGLQEVSGGPPVVSGHKTSLPIACTNDTGRTFLLKFFIAPAEGRFYPAEVRIDDYARRETGFYRLLDTFDRERKHFPAPRTVVIDAHDPPRWLLLEHIKSAPGPIEEVIGSDHVFELLERIAWIKPEVLLGRRDFPVNRWDAVSYLDRVRMMYDPVVELIGARRWTRVLNAMGEGLRWMEARPYTFVHGDFTEQNILVDEDARPHLVDFERVGAGNEDHDFAWLLARTNRGEAWKHRLLGRYFEERLGSRRIAAEWGIRATWIYLALRSLRFGYLSHGRDAPQAEADLALLDRALEGGRTAFPT
ncbi:MAG: phosphotransferase [Planctomycetota bacterium]